MDIGDDLFYDCFGDQRLDTRARALVAAMSQWQSVVVRQLGSTRSEQAGYYRLLNNASVLPEQIIEELTGGCGHNADGEHVLLLSDSTEANFESHRGRIKVNSGLGKVGNNKDLGLFLHTTLAIKADTGCVLGYADVQYWTRQHAKPTTRDNRYKKLPIEQKESYRWMSSLSNSTERLPGAAMLTFVADAEADIYEQWSRMPGLGRQLLINSRGDRCIAEGCGKLRAHLAEQEPIGEYSLKLEADRRKQYPPRVAKLVVRSAVVHLLRPSRPFTSNEPQMVAVTAIYVRELDQTIPNGHPGIDWMLLTTHTVEDFEDAREIIGWYVRRWNIEQLFRLLKHQGLQLESSQLESGQGLIRLSLFALASALRVLTLLLTRHGDSAQRIETIFPKLQQDCLRSISRTLPGSNRTSRNPEPELTMKWALWIIARLGGWKAMNSERPPGPITLFRGLQRFEQIFQGWLLPHDG
jgi:hypothetical protein